MLTYFQRQRAILWRYSVAKINKKLKIHAKLKLISNMKRVHFLYLARLFRRIEPSAASITNCVFDHQTNWVNCLNVCFGNLKRDYLKQFTSILKTNKYSLSICTWSFLCKVNKYTLFVGWIFRTKTRLE